MVETIPLKKYRRNLHEHSLQSGPRKSSVALQIMKSQIEILKTCSFAFSVLFPENRKETRARSKDQLYENPLVADS
jgi:hypothetical protein